MQKSKKIKYPTKKQIARQMKKQRKGLMVWDIF